MVKSFSLVSSFWSELMILPHAHGQTDERMVWYGRAWYDTHCQPAERSAGPLPALAPRGPYKGKSTNHLICTHCT